jgi:MinD-like ATPase involved in chromosome partitioning or flagellar assembly
VTNAVDEEKEADGFEEAPPREKSRSGRKAKTKAGRDLAKAPRGEALLEYFRLIYLSVQPPADQGLVPSIGITSAVSGEGRTTIATGVAAAMAADLDRSIVLVEVDLAHPGVHQLLGINPEPGLAEYLRGECALSEAVHQISDKLFVLPAGAGAKEAPNLIYRLARADLRSRMNTSDALLVLDLPPVLTTSYGALAASMAEALVFVVRAGGTTNEQIYESLTRLGEKSAPKFVLNGYHPQLPRWLQNLAE